MNYSMRDLKTLINSLTGAEKRYYSIISRAFHQNGEEPMYQKLFATLSKDKSELPEIWEGSSPQVYTTAKKQLFSNLLRSLRIYHQDKSPEIIIQNQLSEVEILYHLNLAQQSLIILNKARKMAREHEKFGLLLQILDWERRLGIALDSHQRLANEIQKEERDVLKKLSQIMDIESVYAHARNLKKQYGYVKGVMKENLERETIHAPEMPTLSKCLSKKAVYYYNSIYALYYWMIFDHAKAFKYSKELLEPTLQVVIPNDYIDGILEHVTSCVCLCRFDDAINGLNVASAFVEELKLNQSQTFRFKLFYYQACYRIIIYNYTGNNIKLQDTVNEVELKMKQYDGQLTLETKQVLIANLLTAYVGLGNVKKVDELWDGLFRKQSKSVRRDIYDDLYLFRLFNLLQSKTYILVQPMAASALRYYKKYKNSETHFDIELKIADLLQKDHDLERTEIKREVLEAMKNIVNTYIRSLKGLNGFQEHYTLYVIWIESLLSGKTFHLEAKQWYARFVAKS